MSLARLFVIAILVVGLVGGAASCTKTVLVAEDYDASCAANSDCVIVTLGDQCAACSSDFAALHDAALDDVDADRAAAQDACAPWSARYTVECAVPLPEFRPVCEGGSCKIPSAGAACSFDDGDGLCRGVDAP